MLLNMKVYFSIWNWLRCQVKTNDERWFRFVHHKPLRTYEIDPAFTKTAADGAQWGNP